MEITTTQALVVYELIQAIEKMAQDDVQDIVGIRKLADAAKSVMTELAVK